MTTRREKAGHEDPFAKPGRGCFPPGAGGEGSVPGRINGNGRGLPPRRGPEFTRVPVLGSVAAGRGEDAERVDLGTVSVDLEALNIPRTSRVFALRVRGDSMVGANIADGDVVIVDTREPRPGDIVAALIDGETTLKRFVARDGEVFLKAENPRYPDLIPLNELVVQGVVRAVVRG